MSLLEDIFLQDEADEAQELERVIEGDEYDERARSRSESPTSDGNEPKDDEAEEDKRRVDPTSSKTKRVTKNPRFLLNPARLTGPRGIQILPNHFKDFKFKGKGHEKEDLDMVLKMLEHWAYRLYPKFQFEDCLKKIESLGKKRPVMVHLQKIRTDQFMSEETVVQKDSSDEESQPPQEQDEFDKLLQQQIDLARATPAPGSVKKVLGTPKKDRSPFTMPKATSSPSISDDQKERMIRNRKLAEERRLARLKQNSMDTSNKQDSIIIEVDEETETDVTAKKNNKSHVIDSSDDECGVTSVNQSVAVDVHNGTKKDEESNDDGKIVIETRRNSLQDIETDENLNKNVSIQINEDVIEVIDFDKDTDRNVKETKSPDTAVDGKIVIEADGNNHQDVEMDENLDNDDVVQVTENVQVIDDGKSMGRNVREIEHALSAVDEIIEINDPTDKIIERNQVVIDGVIEVNDESNQGTEIIEIDCQPVKSGKNIEINDHVFEIMDDGTHKESKLSDNTDTIPEVEINSIVKSNNTIENQSKTSNNESIEKEKDRSEENQDGSKGSNSNKSSINNILEKDSNVAEEEIEDIMDVDFSDEF